jgi:hypothetical protein
MLENINLRTGIVSYNVLDFIKVDESLAAQQHNLDEDLLQIQYGTHYLVDVGWYPSFDLDGSFCIRVIKDHDWEHPLLEKDVKIEQLLLALQECIDFAANLQKKG